MKDAKVIIFKVKNNFTEAEKTLIKFQIEESKW